MSKNGIFCDNTDPFAAAAIRRVRLTNLPSTYTASQVASLVFGGPVEEIMFTPGHPSATVMFVHATDCTDYYNITGNGIKLPSEREHIVWVELGDEVDPMSGLSKSQVEGGCTRALRAIGVEEDWTVAGLTKLASGKGGNARKVQGISIKTDRTTGVRLETSSSSNAKLTRTGTYRRVLLLQHQRRSRLQVVLGQRRRMGSL